MSQSKDSDGTKIPKMVYHRIRMGSPKGLLHRDGIVHLSPGGTYETAVCDHGLAEMNEQLKQLDLGPESGPASQESRVVAILALVGLATLTGYRRPTIKVEQVGNTDGTRPRSFDDLDLDENMALKRLTKFGLAGEVFHDVFGPCSIVSSYSGVDVAESPAAQVGKEDATDLLSRDPVILTSKLACSAVAPSSENNSQSGLDVESMVRDKITRNAQQLPSDHPVSQYVRTQKSAPVATPSAPTPAHSGDSRLEAWLDRQQEVANTSPQAPPHDFSPAPYQNGGQMHPGFHGGPEANYRPRLTWGLNSFNYPPAPVFPPFGPASHCHNGYGHPHPEFPPFGHTTPRHNGYNHYSHHGSRHGPGNGFNPGFY